MSGKTLTTASVTGTINANTLTALGDGSSADGKITLNCSQNSHGVSIASPAHSAGQSYTLKFPTGNITAGTVLKVLGITLYLLFSFRPLGVVISKYLWVLFLNKSSCFAASQ